MCGRPIRRILCSEHRIVAALRLLPRVARAGRGEGNCGRGGGVKPIAKNCGKIAGNCDKLRKIAENWEKLRNCGKLRKIADLNPPPPGAGRTAWRVM